MIAAIGPSICQDCYEVSEDVIMEVKRNFNEELWDNVCTHCNSDILFSHRTTGGNRGNLSAFLALK